MIKRFLIIIAFCLKATVVLFAQMDSSNIKQKNIKGNDYIQLGYGKIKSDNITGAISVIESEDFNNGLIISPQELIMGKSAGLLIYPSGIMPNSTASVRIRGNSSLYGGREPLYVVDGIPLIGNALNFLNMDDIDEFIVLKDAAAHAIYGTLAANGAIIINTKKAKCGDKFQLNYNGYLAVSSLSEKVDMFSGDEYRSLIFSRNDANSGAVSLLGTANTDWQDQIYQNAISHNHHISISGVKTLPYRVGIGYTDNNGVLKYANMKRTSFDLSTNPSMFNDDLNVSLNAKAIFTKNNFSNPDAIPAALIFDPTQPVKNGNTRYGAYTTWIDPASGDPLNGLPNNLAPSNPAALLEFRDNKSDEKRYLLSGKLDYKLPFLKDLRTVLVYSYDLYDNKGHDNIDTLASWSYREPEQNITSFEQTEKNKYFEAYLNYSRNIPSINSYIDIVAGYATQNYSIEGENTHSSWEQIDGAYINEQTIPYKSENSLVSFFGALNYSLQDRYLISFSLRREGSSRFAEENRWGLFPTLALAWKIHEEGFLKNADFISKIKLRLSYGVIGNQDIPANLNPNTSVYILSQTSSFYQFGDSFYAAQSPIDANLNWEETTTKNIGLDFGFLNNRITGMVDLYKNTTKDLFNLVPVASGTSFSNYLLTNAGSVENKGIEFSLNFIPVLRNNFNWQFGFNFSHANNEIINLGIDNPSYIGISTGGISGGVGNTVQINSVGYPMNSFFVFQQIYSSNGLPIEGFYVDRSGNGGDVSADVANKYQLGKPTPDIFSAFNSRINFNAWEFSFSARANIGNYVYDNLSSSRAIYQNLYSQSGFLANVPKSINETNFETAQYWSDYYVKDASFLNMDYISLAYTFNKTSIDKTKFKIYATAQNPFLITQYDGVNPEVFGGIDKGNNYLAKTFILGLKINL